MLLLLWFTFFSAANIRTLIIPTKQESKDFRGFFKYSPLLLQLTPPWLRQIENWELTITKAQAERKDKPPLWWGELTLMNERRVGAVEPPHIGGGRVGVDVSFASFLCAKEKEEKKFLLNLFSAPEKRGKKSLFLYAKEKRKRNRLLVFYKILFEKFCRIRKKFYLCRQIQSYGWGK